MPPLELALQNEVHVLTFLADQICHICDVKSDSIPVRVFRNRKKHIILIAHQNERVDGTM